MRRLWLTCRALCVAAAFSFTVVQAHAVVGIVPPNLSGTLAGSLPGGVIVTPKGAASYRIPLATPPGTAGVSPAVALEYDSQAGTDILGVGWKIGGLSQITRCGKTQAVDGVTRGVRLDAQDPFCLDGQRLVKVSGTHGATAEYRTEIDGISRIRSTGSDVDKGPDNWIVATKDGRTLSYGTTAGSQFIAPGETAKLTWAIARSEDRYGNYASYQYVDGEGTGEFYLTRIRYTGNDASSPALVPYISINFLYEDRPDTWSGFVSGSLLWRLKRLTAIQVRTNTAADGSGGTFKREWKVAYSPSATSARSLVSSITDCDASGACLPATGFQYSTRNSAANTFDAPGSGEWVGGPTGIRFKSPEMLHGTKSDQLQKLVLQADVDGDAKADLIYSSGNGIWQVCKSTGSALPCTNWSGPAVASEFALTGDFNRDGRADVAIPPTTDLGALGTWAVCLSTGSAFNCTNTTARAYGRQSPNRYRMADFTGDGRDDLMTVGNQNGGELTYLCPSNGVGFDTCVAYGQAYAFTLEDVDPDYKQRVVPLQADFNGDGRMDVFKFTTWTTYGQYEVFLAGDSGFVSGGGTGVNTLPYPPSPRGIADMNLDGYPDVTNGSRMVLPPSTVVYKVETCRYSGAGIGCNREDVTDGDLMFATQGEAAQWDGTDQPTLTSSRYVNGVLIGGIVRVLPTGEHRDFTEWTLAPMGTSDDGALQSADLNGDGLSDRIRYNDISKKWSVFLTGSASHPDLLTKVTNGYGHETQVQYKGLYDATVYSPGAEAAWPKRNQTTGAPVVSRVRVAAASGEAANHWLDTDYSYAGLRTDLQGRGSLGFEKVAVSDAQTRVTTTTTYSQAHPTTGMPLAVEARHSNGVVLSLTTNTLSAFATVAGANYPYVRVSTVDTNDLDGTPLPRRVTRVGTSASSTNGIDVYGNLTKLQESVTDGADNFTTVVDSTFSNNTTSWLIGLRSLANTTKAAPGAASVTRQIAATYDAATGRVLTETIEPNTAALRLETVYTVDSTFGLPTKKTLNWVDPVTAANKSRITETLAYDGKWRYPTGLQNALGHEEIRTYDDATGQILSVRGPNLLTTSWVYDGWGRKIREDRADGTATTWAYRACVDTCGYGASSAAVTVTQQWANVGGVDEQTVVPFEAHFDKLGRQVMTRTWDHKAEPIMADWVFDADGRLRMVSRPHTLTDGNAHRFGWSLYTRDDLGRTTKIETTNQNGGANDATLIGYAGLSTATTNANGQVRAELLNGLGKPKAVTDPNGKQTSYAYDPWGNLLTTTDPKGNQLKVTYDTLGRKTQLKDPDLGTWTYKVNPLGQTYEQIDAKAQKTTYTFDALGRLTDRVEPDQQSHWVYDTGTKGIGKPAEEYTGPSTAKDYQRIHSYDSLGRPAKTITRLDWDYSTLYSYNGYSQIASLTHRRNTIGLNGGNSAQTYNLSYNNQGAIYQIKRDSTLLWSRNTQDALGRTTQETFGSGLITQRDYNDWTGRVESIETGTVDANSIFTPNFQDDTYTYDSLGNLLTRSQLVANGGAAVKDTFTYDTLNRLKTTRLGGNAIQTLAYDELGNLTTKPSVGTYTYPASGATSVRPHAVTAITGTVAGLNNPSFSYDANGNLKLGLNRGYRWSAANYPTAIDKLTNGTLASAVERTEFTYGPDRQRAKQIVRAMAGQTEGAVKRTIYYAGAIEKEVDLALNTTFIRTYLPEGLGYTLEPIAGVATPASTTTASTRYFHPDHLGSPSVISGLDGTEKQRLSHDAWGRRRSPSGSDDAWTGLGTLANNEDNTGYSGQEQLDSLGLVHLNGRVYDPITARMVSADPTVPDAGDLQQLNRYSYVTNSPLRYTDPTGFDRWGDEVDATIVIVAKGNGVSAGVSPSIGISGNVIALTSGMQGGRGATARAVAARQVVPGSLIKQAVRATGVAGPLGLYFAVALSALDLFGENDDGRYPFPTDDNAFGLVLSAGANSNVPSNVGPGPNAGESVPAGPTPRPTKEQQDKINEIGDRDGCHTCGTKDPGTKSGNWVGDHQDPTKLNPEGKPQRYYPQCRDCSNEQGGRIRWLPGL
jgi:RHS repeat-associated protein